VLIHASIVCEGMLAFIAGVGEFGDRFILLAQPFCNKLDILKFLIEYVIHVVLCLTRI